MAVGGGGGEGAGVGDAFDFGEAVGDEFVGAVLNPLGGGGVGWASVGRVVFEAAVFGRVVGRGDHDSVGAIFFAGRVVGKDGVREGGGGGVGELVVDHHFDAVGGEDFECCGERGFREGVGVLGKEKGSGDGLPCGGNPRWPG